MNSRDDMLTNLWVGSIGCHVLAEGMSWLHLLSCATIGVRRNLDGTESSWSELRGETRNESGAFLECAYHNLVLTLLNKCDLLGTPRLSLNTLAELGH
jgi:hypothetical protein